ncbi:MAG TPA: nitrite/sulfite reductase [Burkholderiaceae bacterium]|jgi:sulfite reductase (NADPH) hemoprotein beta-component|nr:nitrite/sulfite reductase [Burkholderiaceae bacterium]
MYRYTEFDQRMVDERVAQYRDQVARYLRGELTDDEFRPLRLRNGLYLQRHAPMLRLAIPYGLLSSQQMRMLAHVARTWDRGYGHFTTRQNIQFNWPRLEDSPDILQALATVQMHAIQTSGNSVRNITTDPMAGVAPDEQVDPRPYSELVRQWSTFHPEFSWLPRKFKIALTGASGTDRAATAMHDIGLYLKRDDTGAVVVDVLAGGGMGRTPVVGTVIRADLPWRHVLSYCEAILRVYNRYGRRDNIYKARIKILLRALGAEQFTREVDSDFAHLEGGPATATEAELARIAAGFEPPPYRQLTADPEPLREQLASHPGFARWHARNVSAHRVAGYAAVTLSLKRPGTAPGDLDAERMDAVADLAERFSFGELRVTHEQNLVLADVTQQELFALWSELRALGLATPNIGLLTDIVCCPGGDFCSLANAKSLPIAEALQQRFDDADYVHDLGDLTLNISGCINSCGHHHVGNIGILGVDKKGAEFYQVTLGGDVGPDPASTRVGTVIGPSFSAGQVPDVIAAIVDRYVELRTPEERFIDTLLRAGVAPFKTAAYAVAGVAGAESEILEHA